MRQLYVVHSSPEFLAQLVLVMQRASLAGYPKQILGQPVPELPAEIPWGTTWDCEYRIIQARFLDVDLLELKAADDPLVSRSAIAKHRL